MVVTLEELKKQMQKLELEDELKNNKVKNKEKNNIPNIEFDDRVPVPPPKNNDITRYCPIILQDGKYHQVLVLYDPASGIHKVIKR